MEKYAKQLNDYLELMSRSTLLVSEGDRRNMQVLLTMLGPIDEDILKSYYGLFGCETKPLDDIARCYRLTPDSLADIIAKDLRRLAVTPEWQMLLRHFSPLVKSRIQVKL